MFCRCYLAFILAPIIILALSQGYGTYILTCEYKYNAFTLQRKNIYYLEVDII